MMNARTTQRDRNDTAMGADRSVRRARLAGLAGALLALLLGMPGAHAAAPQEGFATPQQAADALAQAWRDNNRPGLVKLFGPAGAKLVSSGDEVADKNAKTRLAAAYDAHHRIVNLGGESALLVIGKEGFPFPIPLAMRDKRWYFDTKAGAEEILDRRIGRNELGAIRVCRAYVEAQRDYAAQNRTAEDRPVYAMKIASADGKHDGLYWEAQPGQAESPLGPLMAAASDEGYSTEAKGKMLAPYHGYRYRILTRQGPHAPGKARNYIVNGQMTGGYALVAYPAEYGNSGIMTFIVNQDGIVFEKNLGKDTAKIARNMTAYDPDRSWQVAMLPSD